jgi:hypothetical protein
VKESRVNRVHCRERSHIGHKHADADDVGEGKAGRGELGEDLLGLPLDASRDDLAGAGS